MNELRTTALCASIVSLALVAICGCSGGSTDTSTSAKDGKVGTAAATAELTGAGSTFVNPAMSKWAYTYGQANQGVKVNYQSVGSGAGIAQYKAGTVDFGATDAPVNAADLAAMPTPTVQFPIISGCEVLAYNLPGISSGMKLSGDVIADIFLGKIKVWNDPRIAAQNADLKLPATPIAVAHRSDGSGTTFIFTDYLSSVSSDWKAGPGKGKTVNWPVGTGGKGNEGVAGLVKQTPGGIGYVELAYAVQAKLTYGPIRNKSNVYVDATLKSTTAAADGAVEALKKDVTTSIVNSDAKDAYPIAGFTYVLVSKSPKDAAKSKALVDFLKWTLGAGQDMASELHYAPLPKSIIDMNTAALDTVGSK